MTQEKLSKDEPRPSDALNVPLDKSTSSTRWIILILACLMLVGSYYCFDIPAALKTQLDDYMGDPSDYEMRFGLLYTLYAAPNVILPFFGGVFVDKLGVRLSLLVFCSLITLGQLLFCMGVTIKSWPLIFIGRLVFGFGGESFTVANSVLLAEWFKGRELAFAFGINLSVAKLGSVFNNMASPALTNSAGLLFALWFGTILCGFSLLCVVATMPLDKAMDERIEAQAQLLLENEKLLKKDDDNAEDEEEGVSEPETGFKDVWNLKHIFWVLVISCMVVYGCVLPFNNISSSLLLERDYFMEPPSECQLADPYQCEDEAFNQPVNCPSSKWYQPPIPVNFTASDIDCNDDYWSDGCAKEYCNRLTDGESQASVIMSIPYIISAILSPPLGFAVDIYGMRAIIAAVAPGILIIVHLLLGYTDVNVIIPLIGQGLAYTGFVSVLWPAVPLVVEERVSGLAFGVVTSAQNLACALVPLAIAAIYSESNDKYIPNVELLFIAFASIGFLVGLYMNYYDYHHDSVLNRSADAAEAAVARDARNSTVFSPLLNPIGNEDLESSSISHDGRQRSSEYDQQGLHHRHNRQSRASQDGRGHQPTFTVYEEAHRGGVHAVVVPSSHEGSMKLSSDN